MKKPQNFCHFFKWAGASSEQDAFFARLLWDLPRKSVSIQLAPPKLQHGNLSLQRLLLMLLQHGGATRKVAWHWGGTSPRLPNCIGFLKPKVIQSQPPRFLKASWRSPRLRETHATTLTMAHVTHLNMISFSSSNAILLHLLLQNPNGVSGAFFVETNLS